MTSRDLSLTRPTRPWWTLIPFLVEVTAVAGLGGLAATGSQATYRSIDLPPYAPPAAAFGPVWSVLYVLIAIGVYGTLTVAEVIAAGDTALAEAAEPLLGQAGFTMMAVAALLATASSVNANSSRRET